jgi:hypothetical protein
MRPRAILVAVAIVGLGTSCWPTGQADARTDKPGVERWPIKTSVVANAPRKAVPLTTLLALEDVPGVHRSDERFQAARIKDFDNPARLEEGDIVTTTGWLHLVAGEGDGDYHIQISASPGNGNHCLIVEVPLDNPRFVASAALRQQAAAVRGWIRSKLLRGQEPSENGSVMMHPTFVRVTGQLFYDDAHVGDEPRGKKGMKAATLWELHPVTSIAFAPVPK